MMLHKYIKRACELQQISVQSLSGGTQPLLNRLSDCLSIDRACNSGQSAVTEARDCESEH